MNPNDYYFHSFKQIGAQIDRINKFYQSPIADFAKRQQALYENMGSTVRPLDPLADCKKLISPFEQFRIQSERIKSFYSSPVADFATHHQALYEHIGTSASSALSFQKITEATQMAYTPFEQIIKTYHNYSNIFSDVSVIRKMDSVIELFHNENILYPFVKGSVIYDILNTDLDQESFPGIKFENTLKPLFNVVDSLQILPDHAEVSIPPSCKTNVPLTNQTKEHTLDFQTTVALLSLIIALIALAVSVLAWFFPDPLNHSTSEDTSNSEIVLTPEQKEEIAGYLANISEKMDIIISYMDMPAEADPIPDSQLSAPQSDIATPSSAKVPDHEEPCTYGNSPELSITE